MKAALSTLPAPPPWRLVHVASLNKVKDQRTLLQAFKLLIDRRVDAHLDIAGEDTLGGEMQHAAAALGVSHRVTFHGQIVSPLLHRGGHGWCMAQTRSRYAAITPPDDRA